MTRRKLKGRRRVKRRAEDEDVEEVKKEVDEKVEDKKVNSTAGVGGGGEKSRSRI